MPHIRVANGFRVNIPMLSGGEVSSWLQSTWLFLPDSSRPLSEWRDTSRPSCHTERRRGV